MHPRRRRVGQDPRAHPAHRPPGRPPATLDPRHVLALTFTRKAAGELRSRLRAPRPARHRRRRHLPRGRLRAAAGRAGPTATSRPPDAARPQGRASWPGCSSAGRARAAAAPTALDIVGEIEWAKARAHRPDGYAAGGRGGGRDAATSTSAAWPRVYERYEDEKRQRRMVDFDDLLARVPPPTSVDDERVRRRPAVALPAPVRRRVPGRQPAAAGACSTPGSATAPTCASWATPTRRSTRGTAPTPATSTTFADQLPRGRDRRASPTTTAPSPADPRRGQHRAAGGPARGAGLAARAQPARRPACPPSRSYADAAAEATAIARSVRDHHRPGRPLVRPGRPRAHQRPDRR